MAAKKKTTPKKKTTAKASVAEEARNPKLEEKILADPESADAYAVYADWLQERGELRGELIALQLAGKDKEAKKLIAKHEDYFLGPLAKHQKTYDGDLGNNNRANSDAWVREHQQTFLWKNGFIHRLRLAHNVYAMEEGEGSFDGKLADVLKLALAHPSARFLAQINFNENGEPDEDNTLDDLWKVIEKTTLPTVRKMIVGDNVDQISWYQIGKIGRIWKAVPNLQTLEIESGGFDLGEIDLPKLERAIFHTGGLSKKSMQAIASANWPKMQHLEVYFGDDSYGGDCKVKDVQPLLDRTDLKNLTYLGLKNSEFANDLAKALPKAKILKTVKTLDLSLGTLTDEGAEALAAAKDALAHLETLDLTRNYLTAKGLKVVKGLAKNVITQNQQKPNDWGDGTLHYYVAVAE